MTYRHHLGVGLREYLANTGKAKPGCTTVGAPNLIQEK